MLLEAEQLTKSFGGLTAVSNVSFGVEESEILGLVGPNGAGKTTVVNVIGGLYPPTSGRVLLEGMQISGLKPYQVAALGIGRIFQTSILFDSLSVLENVRAGFHMNFRTRPWQRLLRSRAAATQPHGPVRGRPASGASRAARTWRSIVAGEFASLCTRSADCSAARLIHQGRLGGTAGLSGSVCQPRNISVRWLRIVKDKTFPLCTNGHCWTSQQWHP